MIDQLSINSFNGTGSGMLNLFLLFLQIVLVTSNLVNVYSVMRLRFNE